MVVKEGASVKNRSQTGTWSWIESDGHILKIVGSALLEPARALVVQPCAEKRSFALCLKQNLQDSASYTIL